MLSTFSWTCWLLWKNVYWEATVISFHSQMFWGLISYMQMLKVGVPDLGEWILYSSGRSSRFVNLLPIWERLGLGLSYLLWCGLFLICPMWRICSTSFQGFFSEEIVSYVAVDSMCLEGGEFRISLCHRLESPSLKHLIHFFLELPLKESMN